MPTARTDVATVAEWERKGIVPPGTVARLTGTTDVDIPGEIRENERVRTGASTPAGPYTPPLARGNGMPPQSSTAPAPVDPTSPPASFDPSPYLAEVSSDRVLVRATHTGEPIPKARARYSRRSGRMFTPGETKDHQEELANIARSQIGAAEPDGDWAFGIRAVFYVQTHHRKDVDNMLKAVLDAMNKIVFRDDMQVKEIMGWSVMDCERPRTEFVVYRLHKIDRESGICCQCGAPFRRYKSWRHRLFCSRACAALKAQRSVQVPCAGCGKLVLREPNQVERVKFESFCSPACRSVNTRLRANCSHCNKPISRPASLAKKDQTRFFCSPVCTAAARVGTTRSTSPEALREAARKGWATRRAKAG